MEIVINNRMLRLVEGDITEQRTEAIVNAANKRLQLGAGVAGAIRKKGGPAIQQECDRIGGCEIGGAVITTGGDLKAKHVIHAVGPRATNPDADDLLASATRASLRVADENDLSSITFPAISTGVFGYSMDKCARIMLSIAIDYLNREDTNLELVAFCLYGQEAFDVFAVELTRQTDDS